MDRTTEQTFRTDDASRRTTIQTPDIGCALRDLSQLIPQPDYCNVAAKIRQHPNVNAIGRLVQELPDGTAKVTFENRQVLVSPEQATLIRRTNGDCDKASPFLMVKIPYIKLLVPSRGNVVPSAGHISDKGKTRKRFLLQKRDEADILQFLLDVGFTEDKQDRASDYENSIYYLSTPHEGGLWFGSSTQQTHQYQKEETMDNNLVNEEENK